MIGLNHNTSSLMILSLPYERSKSLQNDLALSYLTLNVVLKRIPALSTQVTGLCSAWASHLRQARLWYLAKMPLTTQTLQLYSGKSYRELSSLLTTENLTLRDFTTYLVSYRCTLIQCLPPTPLMSVLDAMDSRRGPSKT